MLDDPTETADELSLSPAMLRAHDEAIARTENPESTQSYALVHLGTVNVLVVEDDVNQQNVLR